MPPPLAARRRPPARGEQRPPPGPGQARQRRLPVRLRAGPQAACIYPAGRLQQSATPPPMWELLPSPAVPTSLQRQLPCIKKFCFAGFFVILTVSCMAAWRASAEGGRGRCQGPGRPPAQAAPKQPAADYKEPWQGEGLIAPPYPRLQAATGQSTGGGLCALGVPAPRFWINRSGIRVKLWPDGLEPAPEAIVFPVVHVHYTGGHAAVCIIMSRRESLKITPFMTPVRPGARPILARPILSTIARAAFSSSLLPASARTSPGSSWCCPACAQSA